MTPLINREVDTVIFDYNFELPVFITIVRLNDSDYSIKLEFDNLTNREFLTLKELFESSEAVKFQSKIIYREHLDITHVLGTQFYVDDPFNVIVKFLSVKESIKLESNWDNVKLTLGGKEIKGIRSVTFKLSRAELETKLKQALENEDYLLCTEIQKEIDNYKTE